MRASSTPDLNAMRDASLRMLRAIDVGLAPLLWRGASTVMRSSVSQAEFVQGIETTRAELGGLKTRRWMSIESHVIAEGAGVPPGSYINTRFVARDAFGDDVQELLTFHLDDDQVWRVTGYIARRVNPKTVAAAVAPRASGASRWSPGYDHLALEKRFPGLTFSASGMTASQPRER